MNCIADALLGRDVGPDGLCPLAEILSAAPALFLVDIEQHSMAAGVDHLFLPWRIRALRRHPRRLPSPMPVSLSAPLIGSQSDLDTDGRGFAAPGAATTLPPDVGDLLTLVPGAVQIP